MDKKEINDFYKKIYNEYYNSYERTIAVQGGANSEVLDMLMREYLAIIAYKNKSFGVAIPISYKMASIKLINEYGKNICVLDYLRSKDFGEMCKQMVRFTDIPSFLIKEAKK